MKNTQTPEVDELPKTSPFLVLDPLRGIAAIWVVMAHSCLPYILNRYPQGNANPIYFFSLKGQLGVAIFFVVSGYCIFNAAYNCIRKDQPVARYFRDRVRRIYPPYLAALVVAVIFNLGVSYLQTRGLLPQASQPRQNASSLPLFWIANMTLTQTFLGFESYVFVAWSLCFEIAFYAIVGIALWISGQICGDRRRGRAAQLQYFAIVSTLIVLILAFFVELPFPFNRWYQFGFGAMLFGFIGTGRWPHRLAISLSVICLVTCILYALTVAPTDTEVGRPSEAEQAMASVFTTLALLVVYPIRDKIPTWPVAKMLAWIGSFSYSIYLIHTFSIPFADVGLRRLGFTESLYGITYVSQIFVALLTGWMFYIVVERRFVRTAVSASDSGKGRQF